MNWLIARFNWIHQGSGKWSSMGPSFGVPLVIGCLLFAPLRVHAWWIWLVDPSSVVLVVALPTLARELFLGGK